MKFGLPTVDYLVILFYLALMLGIGFFFSKLMKGGKDFFVGGNMIPWWAAGLSLFMTTFSAWMFTGAASFAYNTGWFGILYFITTPISFLGGFLLSAKRWRRSRITSPVEYVQTRFNKVTHLFLSIMLILSLMYWPAHHLASLSKICAPTLFPNSMLAIDIMIIFFAIVILIYTFSGGFWAVCITDVVQAIILMSVIFVLIPTIFLSGELGSITDFIKRIPPLELKHVIRDKTTYTYWYIIGVATSHIFGNAVADKAQRFYSVKDEKAAMKVGWLAFALFLTAPIMFGIPPLVGKVLWPDISQLAHFSNITKPDENVYIAVVLRYMPAGIVGMFLSAMMAASMSALDSVWNTVSSIISIDIYKNLFKPKATEKEVLMVGRLAIIVLFFFAVSMAFVIIHSEYGVFTFSTIFFSLTGVPISIPLVLGIIIKDIGRWSGVASILAGTLIASVARFVLKFTLGPQMLLTVAVTLFFILISNHLGRLYIKNKTANRVLCVAIGILFWFIFVTGNADPNISLTTFFTSDGSLLFLSAKFWMTMAALAYIVMLLFFSRLYAKDLLLPQTEIDQFFEKLNTPIDVDSEVLKDNEEKSVFPLVGGICIAFSMLSLIVLVSPAAREKIGVNLVLSGILFLIGMMMFLSDPKILQQIKNLKKA